MPRRLGLSTQGHRRRSLLTTSLVVRYILRRFIRAIAGLRALLLTVLSASFLAVRHRGLDELNRAIAREGSHLAFLWISCVGDVWAMLAHLGFAVAPAPLDWLMMLAGFGFAGGLTAAARRGAFENPT